MDAWEVGRGQPKIFRVREAPDMNSWLFMVGLCLVTKNASLTSASSFDWYLLRISKFLKLRSPALRARRQGSHFWMCAPIQGDPEQSYICEPTCHIVKRAGEHLDCFSERMPTGIGGHIQKCDPCLRALKAGDLSFRNFEILSRCQSKLEAEVREAFLVTKHKPSMNSQLFMSGASLTLKIFGWFLPSFFG